MKFMKKSLLLCLFSSLSFAQTSIDSVTNAGVKRADDGAKAQKGIERVADQVADLAAEYKSVTKEVEGLKVYNSLLKKQLDNQTAEMQAITKSVQDIALIERQIVPLMIRMIDSLEKFIDLDIPFLMDERTTRIANLRVMMERSDVADSEKFRRVLEAYEIEADYGKNIESYKGTTTISGNVRDVDFFRVGRVALTFQTADGSYTGGWDGSSKTFVELPASEYKTHVKEGLKIARKEVAPVLVIVPVQAATEAK